MTHCEMLSEGRGKFLASISGVRQSGYCGMKASPTCYFLAFIEAVSLLCMTRPSLARKGVKCVQ